MRQHHIGSVVVADRTDGRLVPAGMIIDRDVTAGVVALGLRHAPRARGAAR
jgi:hypothetical protein